MVKAVSQRKKTGSAFEILKSAANAYLNRAAPHEITARGLYESLVEASSYSGDDIKYYNPSRYTLGPVILDVRTSDSEMPDPYYAGHVPGAMHVPWHEVASARTLACLPKDRKIIVYSANGQTGGQAAAVLDITGYDVYNLRWGMGSWTGDADAAPGRYDLSRDTIWHEGSAHRTVSSERSTFRVRPPEPETVAEYPFPGVDLSDDGPDAVASAGRRYLQSCRMPNISAQELYRRLYVGQDPYFLCPPGSPEQAPVEFPFLLDVREGKPHDYGYIAGSLHVPWREVFRDENLKRLPPDRLIVVYSGTGHTGAQVTALLGILGYRATNLRFGISAWSLSLPGAEIAPGRYSETRDCQSFRVVQGFEPFVRCTT